MRIGIAGSSFVVVGSAALAALAPVASAAGQYNSSASATSGNVTVANHQIPAVKASSTQDTGRRTSTIPSSQVTTQLQKTLKSAIPGSAVSISGSNLLEVSTDAKDDGTSSGCAAVLASGCQNGEASSMTYTVDLGKLGGSALAGIGGGVTDDKLQLTILGPSALCTAGPDGTGLTTSIKKASVKAQLLGPDNQPIGGAVNNLTGGDLFSQLSSISQLSSAVGALSSATPLKLTNTQGSTHQGGGAASASTGEFGLTAVNTKVLDIGSSQVTCGPNQAQAGDANLPGSNGPVGQTGQTGQTGPGGQDGQTGPAGQNGQAGPGGQNTTTSSKEKALKKIQTDEGRSSSDGVPAWLALNGRP